MPNKIGCKKGEVEYKGRCVKTIVGYHVTDIESWDKIKKQGMKPGTQTGPWQCYDPHWIGTYIFSKKSIAELNRERLLDIPGADFSKKDIPIIEVKVPDVPEWHKRMRPDEDWSDDPKDWVKYKKEGSACVLGKISPAHLRRVG